ncbi:MAG: hypothetical protein M1831_004729 [Alyxoria varia]|nr:MAG: hypothetical protein M1831_004729 [Alyxoria varia]
MQKQNRDEVLLQKDQQIAELSQELGSVKFRLEQESSLLQMLEDDQRNLRDNLEESKSTETTLKAEIERSKAMAESSGQEHGEEVKQLQHNLEKIQGRLDDRVEEVKIEYGLRVGLKKKICRHTDFLLLVLERMSKDHMAQFNGYERTLSRQKSEFTDALEKRDADIEEVKKQHARQLELKSGDLAKVKTDSQKSKCELETLRLEHETRLSKQRKELVDLRGLEMDVVNKRHEEELSQARRQVNSILERKEQEIGEVKANAERRMADAKRRERGVLEEKNGELSDVKQFYECQMNGVQGRYQEECRKKNAEAAAFEAALKIDFDNSMKKFWSALKRKEQNLETVKKHHEQDVSAGVRQTQERVKLLTAELDKHKASPRKLIRQSMALTIRSTFPGSREFSLSMRGLRPVKPSNP